MIATPDTVDGAGRRHRVVVIGSGFGGLTATKALKNASVDITLIARTQHHLFQPRQTAKRCGTSISARWPRFRAS